MDAGEWVKKGQFLLIHPQTAPFIYEPRCLQLELKLMLLIIVSHQYLLDRLNSSKHFRMTLQKRRKKEGYASGNYLMNYLRHLLSGFSNLINPSATACLSWKFMKSVSYWQVKCSNPYLIFKLLKKQIDKHSFNIISSWQVIRCFWHWLFSLT